MMTIIMNVEEYLEKFYNLDKLEKLIINLANDTKTPILSLAKAKILGSLVKLKNPLNCFEIGLGIGFSTYQILKNLDDDSKLISIDKNFHRIEIFYERVYKNFNKELKRKLTVYPLDAFYCMDIFLNLNQKFDFIFIDSQKRDYFYFYDYLVSLTKKEALIVIDNITYNMQTFKTITRRSEKYLEGVALVEKFIDKVSNSKYFSVSFIPAGDGMCCLIRL